MSILKEWNFCHCTAKFWGRELPKQSFNQNFELTKPYQLNAPIITDDFSIIPNNHEQKTTLFVDKGLFLMGSVDFIVLDEIEKRCYTFIVRKVKQIPNKSYLSDEIIATAYNILLFRFLYREEKQYQIRIGFEFLEKYRLLLEKLSTFKIGNSRVGYTINKSEFQEDLISDPTNFFQKYDNHIFSIRFDLKNIKKALDQLISMIDECVEPHYVERDHQNSKKCKNCYYNKLFSCENSVT